MPTSCDGLLTDDILFDCENAMVGGIEVNVLLFNHTDIDKVETTFSNTQKTKITDFVLKSGKTGYLFQGVKQVNALACELVKKEIGPDKWKHTFSGVILNLSTENKERLMEMSSGGLYAAIVELKWKGADNEEAFQLAGFESGLELMTSAFTTAENDGTVSIELSSKEGYEESKPILTVLETDYSTTATAFSNKFAS
jgi:hypothetical protein